MAQRQSLVDGQELVSFHAQAIAWTPETVRQALEAEVKRNCCWSDEPVRDMEIRQLTQSDLWYVKLTSCVETRSMEEKKEIYQGGEVDKEGTPPDEWSMEVTPPEPFQEMTKCYRVPHSDVISQCEECDGRGDVACKRCGRKGWWWCKNCKGEKQIWCEESSDSSSSEAGGKGEDADGKGKGKDDGKGYRRSVEGKGEEPDGKGKGKEDGKGYRSSFEGKGDEPDGKGKGKEDGKGYRSSFEGKGDEPDGKGKGKEDGKGYRSSIAGKGEEADGKGKGKDEGKGYRSSKGSAKGGGYYVTCPECDGQGFQSCETCKGSGKVTCGECKGRGSFLSYKELVVRHANKVFQTKWSQTATQITLQELRESKGPTIHLQGRWVEEELWRANLAAEPMDAILGLVREGSKKHDVGSMVMQKLEVKQIPSCHVTAVHKGKEFSFSVYGDEMRVSAGDYPQQCCGCCVVQ